MNVAFIKIELLILRGEGSVPGDPTKLVPWDEFISLIKKKFIN